MFLDWRKVVFPSLGESSAPPQVEKFKYIIFMSEGRPEGGDPLTDWSSVRR